MPGIFDTHCHLMDDVYVNDDEDHIIAETKMSNVSKLCNVGYDLQTSIRAVNTAMEHSFIYAAVGIHPNNVAKFEKKDLTEVEDLATSTCVVGIGEIGLDYFHKDVSKELQKEWFIQQLRIAKRLDLPVLIHCRDAYEDCYDILVAEGIKKGIMHCFLGTAETAARFISLGFYISFGGVVTFKNAKAVQETVKQVPLSKIVVETDAPYLAPDPYRGRTNYPKYINYTVKKIAALKKTTVESVIRITSKNANNVFGIK